MLRDQLEVVDEAFLAELCAQPCPEAQTLDFKRELPARDRGRDVPPLLSSAWD